MESDNMTKEQAIQKLKALQQTPAEDGHEQADTILCEFLIALGYADVIAEYDKV